MAKLNIGILFGGRSGEHDVSLMSARNILNVLDMEKYNVTEIGITRQGEWLVGEGALNKLTSGKLEGLSPVTLLPDPTKKGLMAISSSEQGLLLNQFANLDVLFPVLHGTFGEDGTLQGLFELADAAFVGAGVLGSAVGMDKSVFKDVMQANNIPVVETILLLSSELQADIDAAVSKAEQVGNYPLFIKPANLGSSLGISKAQSRSDLLESLLEAAQYDRRIIVQKGIDAREIEVSVLGNDDPKASVCGEIIPEAEFYSYEAKYHDDRSKSVIPAEIPAELSERIRSIAIKAYKACDLSGLARVDFFVEKKTNVVYLNELNTMPGFTEISMYPMLWEAGGLKPNELVDELIGLALARKADRDAITHQFARGEN
ncbi:MAG: D-alanine--D-alanine ligase [Chloroflexota bacterium]